MIYEYLCSLGLSNNKIEEIINSYGVSNLTDERLYIKTKNMCEYLIGLGYTDKDILRIITKYPSVCVYDISNVESKIKDMLDLKYSKKELLGMIREYPYLLGLSITNS